MVRSAPEANWIFTHQGRRRELNDVRMVQFEGNGNDEKRT